MILYEVKHRVGITTINRPEKANAFNFDLLEELYNKLIEADRDIKVKCILLKSTGEKIFSAGFDLSSSGFFDAPRRAVSHKIRGEREDEAE